MSWLRLKAQNNTFVTSTSFNPWFNLALEEFLLDNVTTNEVILYLWQNKNTVVIGRNQNPWQECKINKMSDEGVKLARRLSGGGAVYHDLGNLNFTFIMRKELYDLKKQLTVILQAVNSFGLKAKFSGRNDLLLKGKKFSGNAYYFEDEAAYHHGTILINSDLSKLSEYLQPSKEKIISKGIDSVKSRVINLHSVKREITVDKVNLSIFNCFEQLYGKTANSHKFTENMATDHLLGATFAPIYKKYSSWSWTYGESPAFDVSYEQRFSWGEIQIGLNLKNGYIHKVKIYSDALYTSFVDKLTAVLPGVKFKTQNIKQVISSLQPPEEEKQIYKDILTLF
jgi:lipoate-protein ligase A